MRAVLVLVATVPLMAHNISMSNSELVVSGKRGTYELRMPVYEVAHVKDAEAVFFANIRFASAGSPATLGKHSCKISGETYVCTAEYQFSAPPERIQAECTLARVTVPNHVNVLKARRDGKTDQAVFDLSFEKAELRFRQPSGIEIALEQAGAGAMRALSAAMGILFLFALALAARSNRELLALVGAFALGEIAACLALAIWNLELSPRFIEAAMALSLAYLAVEILFLPDAGTRWLVCGVLGLFHGFYFALFIREAGFHPQFVLGGAMFMEFLVVALCWGFVRRFRGTVRFASALLMAVGIGWFGLRLFR